MVLCFVVKEKMMPFGEESRFQSGLSACYAHAQRDPFQTWSHMCHGVQYVAVYVVWQNISL